jgi:hypothetical protein
MYMTLKFRTSTVLAAAGLILTMTSFAWSWPAPQGYVIADTAQITHADTAQFVALWSDSGVTLMRYAIIGTIGYDYIDVINWPNGGAAIYRQVLDSLLEPLNPVQGPGENPLFHFDLNPLNPATAIRFELPFAVNVRLEIYDVAGRLAVTLVNGRMEAGVHQVTFNGSELASGMYFVRMRAGEFAAVEKMVLLK